MADKVIDDLIKGINTHFKKNVVNLGKDVIDDITIQFLRLHHLNLIKY